MKTQELGEKIPSPQPPEAGLCGAHCGHDPSEMVNGECRHWLGPEVLTQRVCGHKCFAPEGDAAPSVLDVVLGRVTGFDVRHVLGQCEKFLCLPERQSDHYEVYRVEAPAVAETPDELLHFLRLEAENMACSLESLGYGRHIGGRMCTPLERYRKRFPKGTVKTNTEGWWRKP